MVRLARAMHKPPLTQEIFSDNKSNFEAVSDKSLLKALEI